MRKEDGRAVGYSRRKQFIGSKAEADQALSKWTGHVELDQQKARADRIASVRNMTVSQLVEHLPRSGRRCDANAERVPGEASLLNRREPSRVDEGEPGQRIGPHQLLQELV
jgi:hypothetical protein